MINKQLSTVKSRQIAYVRNIFDNHVVSVWLSNICS